MDAKDSGDEGDVLVYPPRPDATGDAGDFCPPTAQTGPQSKSGTFEFTGGYLTLCEATLVIQRGAFKSPTSATVTLTRVSSEGILPSVSPSSLVYAEGPVFSITTTPPFTEPPTLELHFVPRTSGLSPDRVRLAYEEPLSHLYFTVPQGSYDATKSMLTSQVIKLDEVNSPTRNFAPMASCGSDSDCLPPKTCRYGQLCQ